MKKIVIASACRTAIGIKNNTHSKNPCKCSRYCVAYSVAFDVALRYKTMYFSPHGIYFPVVYAVLRNADIRSFCTVYAGIGAVLVQFIPFCMI